MKIGIIGNMNNAYFSLARYLRDRGFDCTLLIYNDEPDHFDPSCDSRGGDYRTYTRWLRWGDPARFLKQDVEEVRRDLEPFDFLIGNGPAPAFAARAGRTLDIFMPYGYDIYSLPFFKFVHPVRIPAYMATARWQRRGIRACGQVFFDRTNRSFEALLDGLNIGDKRVVTPNPMIYHPEYDLPELQKDLPEAIRGLRAEHELLFVQHARQLWKNAGDVWSFKGNDLLVRGFADFIARHPDRRSQLVLFEYGSDVAHTKKLVGDIGIGSRVTWMPKMPRKELMQVLACSDLVVGELHHSWLTYGVALEALVLGKPLMHCRVDGEYAGDYPELYPMIHARSAAEVSAGMERVFRDRPGTEAMGKAGRDWFLRYAVKGTLDRIHQAVRRKTEAHA